MSRFLRIAGAAVIAVTLLILATLSGVREAAAQSCPGGVLQVQNKTGCNLQVRLSATPAIAPFFVPAFGNVNIPVTPGTVIHGMISPANVFYPFPPIPPEPACTAPFRVATGCCARGCLFPHNCILQILPTPPPCPA